MQSRVLDQMSTYATTSDLQSQPGLSLLPDADCQLWLAAAEELVDSALGTLPVDPDTGRKVVLAELADWQRDKLRDATVLVAARLQANPAALVGAGYTTQKGPDFEVSGATRAGVAAVMSEDVVSRLRALGLRRLFGRARPNRSRCS